MRSLGEETAEPTITADDDDAKTKIAELQRQLSVLQAQKAGVEIDADASQADIKIATLQARIAQLNAERADPQADLDDAAAKAKIDALQAKLTQLKLDKAGIRISVDASEAEVKIAELQAQIQALDEESGSFSLGGMSGGFPGGMMGMLGTGLAALSPGIAGATTGLGLLGGTGYLALGGIAKALDEAHQSALNVGMTSQQVAAQQFSNAVAVQQAQQSIVQATQQAAEDQVTSAAQVTQALQGITQAEQGVQEADYSLNEAQYQLSQAWEQAREQITQLNDALADSKINVQAASLAVQQAAYNETLVNQNAYSTSLDRQQAALAVVQAQQQLKDAQDQETSASYAANLANQQGVAGSQTVIQAKQAVTQATYGQQQAQTTYQDAVKNAALAQQEAAYTQQRDTEAVTQAQQNLSNTIEEQQLQWASTMSTENEAANQFAKDMARLTPAGQGFVNAVLGLQPAFQGLETAAQNSVLPGMTTWLNGIAKLLPTVQGGVSQMGQAMSTAFGAFGKQMQTPGFAKVLQGLISNGIQFANVVLPAFAQFIQELAIAGSQKGAVTGLANLLAGLANGLTNMVKGLTPFEGALSAVFSVLGSALSDLGGPLGEVLGALGGALAPVLQALLPGFKSLADSLGKGLTEALKGAGPLLGVLGTAVSDIVIALSPLLPQIGTLIGQLARSLVPVIEALLPSVVIVAQAFAKFAGTGGLQALLSVITQVLPPLAQLVVALAPMIAISARSSAAILDFAGALGGTLVSAQGKALGAMQAMVGAWQSAWSGLEQASLYLWHGVLDPMYQALASGALAVWHDGIEPAVTGIRLAFQSAENAALFLWHNIFDPMWGALKLGASGFVSAFQTTWSGMESAFRVPVNYMIGTVYDKGIARLWDDVVGAIGLGSLKLPVIPTLASGGIVPGHDTGRDSQLVMMRPGEGVLQPGAVDAIGGPGAVHALNQQHGDKPATPGGAIGKMAVKLPAKEAVRRVTERPALHLVGFQGGGVLGDIGGFISGAVSGALDVGKMVAAIATGNTAAFTNAAAAMIGTRAAGDLGKIMTGVPKALVADLAQVLTGSGGSHGGGISSPGHVTGTVAQWFAQAVKLAGVPSSWIPDLETIARYESSDNPNAINLSDSNAKAGDPSRGIMQTIMSTFLAYHQPGTSMNIYDPVANIAAAIRYIKSRYGTVASVPGIVSLSHGSGYVGYDSGGWLMPGGMIPSNATGKPEAVLTPEESAAFVAIAKRLTAQGTGTLAPVNNFNYFGPQTPTPEMRAMQMRDLAMTLSGHSA